MHPPDAASIADARLSCPSVRSQWFYTHLLLVAFLHLFDAGLKSRFVPPFLTHWLRKIMQCDLENFLLAVMEKENPLQVSQTQRVALGCRIPMTKKAHCDESGP